MVILSKDFCEFVGLDINATATQFLDCLRTESQDFLDGLLVSEESRAAAEASLENFPRYRLRIEQQIGALQCKYCSVTVAINPDSVLVGLIADVSSGEALPTNLEILIFWTIIDERLSLPILGSVNGDSERVGWRNFFKGKAIIAELIEPSFGETDQQMISALFGLSHCKLPPIILPAPLVSHASAVKLDDQLGQYSAIQGRLLFEASSVQHPKWRFLSLYRILEHAYLTNIKKALLDEFDFDASKAVDMARSKLTSEIQQLVYLAERADLVNDFVIFNTEVDALIKGGNKYIIKLDRSAETESLYKDKDIYKKAVLRFYKMRCSIAHAGTSSVIYEQFSDANLATQKLLPFVESIVLKSMKITTP